MATIREAIMEHLASCGPTEFENLKAVVSRQLGVKPGSVGTNIYTWVDWGEVVMSNDRIVSLNPMPQASREFAMVEHITDLLRRNAGGLQPHQFILGVPRLLVLAMLSELQSADRIHQDNAGFYHLKDMPMTVKPITTDAVPQPSGEGAFDLVWCLHHDDDLTIQRDEIAITITPAEQRQFIAWLQTRRVAGLS